MMTRLTRYLLIVGGILLGASIVRIVIDAPTPPSVDAQQVNVAGTPTAAAQTAQAGLTAIAASNPPPTPSLPIPTITPAPVPISTLIPTTRSGAPVSGVPTVPTGTTQSSSAGSVDGWAVAGIIVFLSVISLLGGAGYRMYRLRHPEDIA
jgi:hypothetical protein